MPPQGPKDPQGPEGPEDSGRSPEPPSQGIKDEVHRHFVEDLQRIADREEIANQQALEMLDETVKYQTNILEEVLEFTVSREEIEHYLRDDYEKGLEKFFPIISQAHPDISFAATMMLGSEEGEVTKLGKRILDLQPPFQVGDPDDKSILSESPYQTRTAIATTRAQNLLFRTLFGSDPLTFFSENFKAALPDIFRTARLDMPASVKKYCGDEKLHSPDLEAEYDLIFDKVMGVAMAAAKERDMLAGRTHILELNDDQIVQLKESLMFFSEQFQNPDLFLMMMLGYKNGQTPANLINQTAVH